MEKLTRKKQIEDEATKKCFIVSNILENKLLKLMFIYGAEWADDNPDCCKNHISCLKTYKEQCEIIEDRTNDVIYLNQIIKILESKLINR